jgi:hypothetical protein
MLIELTQDSRSTTQGIFLEIPSWEGLGVGFFFPELHFLIFQKDPLSLFDQPPNPAEAGQIVGV